MSGQSAFLGDLSGLPTGKSACFPDVGTNGIVVCRVAGKLHAIEDNCSHRDAKLSEGRFRGTLITCPLHGAQFDVRNGAHQGPPAAVGVSSYEVVEGPDGAVVTGV